MSCSGSLWFFFIAASKPSWKLFLSAFLSSSANLLIFWFLFLYIVCRNSYSVGSWSSAAATNLHFPSLTFFGKWRIVCLLIPLLLSHCLHVGKGTGLTVDTVRRSSRYDIFGTDLCGKFSQVPGFFVTRLVWENAFVGTPEVGFYGGAFWTKMQSNRHLHSIGSYPCSTGSYFSSIGSYLSSIPPNFPSIGSYLSSIRSYFHSIRSYLSSIRSYFNYFVASYITLVYSSVAFHIYPYLHGNSIPSDCNYCLARVTIRSVVKQGRLNLDHVFVWRHTTYDYMMCNWKSSHTCGKMAHEGQHQSPLELLTQNVRSSLADVVNKLECGDVNQVYFSLFFSLFA